MVATRLPAGLPIALDRSRCDACGVTLRPLELIPLVSFTASRGRCRHCRSLIGVLPIVAELGGAAVAMSAWLVEPTIAAAAAIALFGWTLLALALLDWRALWLPDRIVLPLLVAGLAAVLVVPEPSLPARLTGAALGYASLEALRLGYRRLRGREGLGGGDPKLFAATGAWLGAEPLPSVMLLASGLGLAVVGVAILSGRRPSADKQLPLGTFLAIAGFAVFVIGRTSVG